MACYYGKLAPDRCSEMWISNLIKKKDFISLLNKVSIIIIIEEIPHLEIAFKNQPNHYIYCLPKHFNINSNKHLPTLAAEIAFIITNMNSSEKINEQSKIKLGYLNLNNLNANVNYPNSNVNLGNLNLNINSITLNANNINQVMCNLLSQPVIDLHKSIKELGIETFIFQRIISNLHFSDHFIGLFQGATWNEIIYYDLNKSMIDPNKVMFSYPENEIERYAFRISQIPWIMDDSIFMYLTSESNCSYVKKKLPLYINNHHFRIKFIKIIKTTFVSLYKYVDGILDTIKHLDQGLHGGKIYFNVHGPQNDCQNITLKVLYDFLINMIKNLIKFFPKQLGYYYLDILPIQTTPFLYMMTTCRYEYCSLFRKYIYLNGRNCHIKYNSFYSYSDKITIISQIKEVFLNNNIFDDNPLRIMLKFKDLSPGNKMKIFNLLRKMLIWKNGPHLNKISSYLRQPTEWWFSASDNQLPIHSIAKMYSLLDQFIKKYM